MTTTAEEQHGRAVPRTTARGLHRALLPLGLAGAVIGLALAVQLVLDPFRQHLPLCLLNHLTGIECPGCGAIRAVHSLLAGDLLLALRSNVLVITAIPLVVLGLAVWTVRRIRGLATNLMPSNTVLLIVAGIALVFMVLRNLPVFWFLAPISYVGG